MKNWRNQPFMLFNPRGVSCWIAKIFCPPQPVRRREDDHPTEWITINPSTDDKEI